MLLVSDLYAQGTPLSAVRSRLVTLGYQNPSVAVLAVADQLAASHDQVKQQEANQLHEFAAALVAASGNDQTAAPVQVQPVPTVASASSATTAVVSVAQTPQAAQSSSAPASAPAAPSSVPANPSAPVAVSAAPPSAKVEPTANAAGSVASAPAPAVAAGAHVGVVHTNDRSPAIIRREANIKSTAVAIAPFGARVDVLGIVQGQAVEPGETRWYHISYGGHQGYMYFKLLQVGG